MTEFDPVAVRERLAGVKNALLAANEQFGKDTQLMAVSKTFPAEAVLVAAQEGQCVFGENYAQEGCDKVDWFKANHPELKLVWHFIGPLQSNKTRPVAERFDWVDSVDRLKIAQRLNDQRPEGMAPVNLLIEVNIDGEDTKSGVAPKDVKALADEIAKLPNVKLRGLMCIPAPAETPEEQAKPLTAMRALFDEMKEAYGIDTLSMGMSADMTVAVECGSTLVRV
ncbi:MAG: YggS family pyridoxal phosphate-dependent enzyme, partial [Sutterellaceae bacterium]|nr:YggS family pyridoxal phosphate-dependent enzyme [Sutterellaceae bacterium]